MVIWDHQLFSPKLIIGEVPGAIYGLSKKDGLSINYLMFGLIIIFKPGAPAAGRRAWFLIITFVCECICVCVCMCVRPRGHKLLMA